MAAWLSAEPPTHLQVQSVTLNPSTLQVTIEIVNWTPDKTAVAYILDVKSFDAAGKQIDDSGIGRDSVGPEPNPEATKYILPGHTASTTAFAPKGTVSVQVLVTGVVYLDRTAEGTTPGVIFGGRGRQAKAARRAVAVVASYLEKPQDEHKTMLQLLTIRSSLVNGILANKLHLGAVPDLEHPPVEEAFSNQQWKDVRTELEQRAAFFEAISQEGK